MKVSRVMPYLATSALHKLHADGNVEFEEALFRLWSRSRYLKMRYMHFLCTTSCNPYKKKKELETSVTLLNPSIYLAVTKSGQTMKLTVAATQGKRGRCEQGRWAHLVRGRRS